MAAAAAGVFTARPALTTVARQGASVAVPSGSTRLPSSQIKFAGPLTARVRTTPAQVTTRIPAKPGRSTESSPALISSEQESRPSPPQVIWKPRNVSPSASSAVTRTSSPQVPTPALRSPPQPEPVRTETPKPSQPAETERRNIAGVMLSPRGGRPDRDATTPVKVATTRPVQTVTGFFASWPAEPDFWQCLQPEHGEGQWFTANRSAVSRMKSVPDMSSKSERPAILVAGGSVSAAPPRPTSKVAAASWQPVTVPPSLSSVESQGDLRDQLQKSQRNLAPRLAVAAADPIDAAVLAFLASEKSLEKLSVRRLGPGQYEVDGRRVSARWAPGVPPGSSAADLLVSEEGVGSPTKARTIAMLVSGVEEKTAQAVMETPLPSYFRQAADVSAALSGFGRGAPAVARIPQEQRLSFRGPGIDVEERESADLMVRCASMRQAVEEARLRAEAAEAYESGRGWQGSMSVPVSPAAGLSRETIPRETKTWSKAAERPLAASRLADRLARLEGRYEKELFEEEEESEESEESEEGK